MQENASHVISLPLFKLNLPKCSLFEPQIRQLTEKSFALENRERRIKATKLVERTETACLFIEGLFQDRGVTHQIRLLQSPEARKITKRIQPTRFQSTHFAM